MNLFSTKIITAYGPKLYPNQWDILALSFVFGVLFLFAWIAKNMVAPYQLGVTIPISLHPQELPYYALSTVARMFIAMFASILFTFVFATWAAKSSRAEKIIIPFIDVLQSVPVLGFLSITVVTFIQLFPGSRLGPECAAIFAIFTAQAWNMALGFYQTIRSVPPDINEAAKMFHLSAWQRFWRIDVPYSMPGLLWNAMMSMSASWFFVVASEAITVNNQEILLPGIGSYIAVAILQADMVAIGYAIFTMFIVIMLYDQFLFRPLVAWSEKFKAELHANEKPVTSWVITLFRRTRFLRSIVKKVAYGFDRIVNIPIFLKKQKNRKNISISLQKTRQLHDKLWNIFVFFLGIAASLTVAYYLFQYFSLSDVGYVFLLGCATGLRVISMILLSSLIWVPIAIWIGLRPKIAETVQPIAQILAAFPANLLFPLLVIFVVQYHLNPEIWLTPLMILGAQWYILFNVIAGASTIPKDLVQVADCFDVKGWQRWKQFFLPAVFPYYVTGAITAWGGAWNASIVAEVASWGHTTLIATGLGAYIKEYTVKGDFPHIALGIIVMCILILLVNRLFWRPLYRYAIEHYSLG